MEIRITGNGTGAAEKPERLANRSSTFRHFVCIKCVILCLCVVSLSCSVRACKQMLKHFPFFAWEDPDPKPTHFRGALKVAS